MIALLGWVIVFAALIGCIYWTVRLRLTAKLSPSNARAFTLRKLKVTVWMSWSLFTAACILNFVLVAVFAASGSETYMTRLWPVSVVGLLAVILPWVVYRYAFSRERRRRPRDEQSPAPNRYDVFLSYNSQDRDAVAAIANDLRAEGLKVWFDQWELQPGLPWQRALELAIGTIGAAAAFVGPNGIGPWQGLEVESYLRQFVARSCPVVPVLLSGCPAEPQLPLFLAGMTWADFRADYRAGLERLIWGITGRRPTGSEGADTAVLPRG
jgi:hypothetical protein